MSEPIDIARLLLYSPEWYDAEGKMHVTPEGLTEWSEVPVYEVSACEHVETLCMECVDSWFQDWFMHPEDMERLGIEPQEPRS